MCARNVAQNRSCWTGQAMLFQRCGMSVFGVFVREYAAGSVLTSVRDWSPKLCLYSGFSRDVLTPGVCEM